MVRSVSGGWSFFFFFGLSEVGWHCRSTASQCVGSGSWHARESSLPASQPAYNCSGEWASLWRPSFRSLGCPANVFSNIYFALMSDIRNSACTLLCPPCHYFCYVVMSVWYCHCTVCLYRSRRVGVERGGRSWCTNLNILYLSIISFSSGYVVRRDDVSTPPPPAPILFLCLRS